MPDKKYLIEIPDMPESSGVWDADKWERNKDKFMQKYPDANIFEVGQYDPNDMDDNDQFMLSFENDADSSGVWDAAKWERNKEAFMAKYPEAHVDRVRYVDYWGNKAQNDKARLEELQRPDEARNAKLAEMGFYDDLTDGQMDFDLDAPSKIGLKPLSSAIKQNSVSGEITYLDPKVEEFMANDTAHTERQMEMNRLREEYDRNPRVVEQREYEAQMARYAADLEKQIKSDMESEVDVVKAARGASAKHQFGEDMTSDQMGYLLDRIAGDKAGSGAEENEKLERYNSALKLLQQAKDAREVAGKGLGGGIADTAKDWVRNAATQSDIEMYNEIGNILTSLERKVGNLNEVSEEDIENNLSKDEKALIRAFFEYNAAMADAGENMSTWYKGGKIFAESIPFMLEFLATGGLATGAGRAATSWMGKGFAKWIAKSAKGTLARTVKKGVAKSVSGVAKTMLAAGARTLAAPSTYKNIAEQSVQYGEDGHLDRGGNMVRAAVDSYIEQLSEMSGAAFGEVLGGIGKLALGKTAFNKIGAWFGNNATMQTLSRLGFHGLPEEVGEEIFGNALRTITGVDNEALSRMFEKDEFASMIIGFAPMTLIGAGTSAAQMGAVSIGAANAGRRMRQDLSRSYTEEQIDQVVMSLDAAKDANQITEAIKPIITSMAAAGAPKHEIQSVWDYAIAVAKKKAMISAQSVQEMQLTEAKIGEVRDAMGERFWIENEDGTRDVKQITLNNGNTAYVVSKPDQDGRVAIINANTGQKGTALPQDIKEESWNGTLNAFGAGLVMADRTLKEQQRMQEERKAQITEVQKRLSVDPRINVGTEGSPINLVVQSFNDAGVRYVTQDGSVGNLSWEQAADSIGMPIVVKTDAQIAQEEADALVAAAAERRSKRAKMDEVGETERNNAVIDAENAVAEGEQIATHIPMNEDGTVNEAAFWEQSPEEYVKWNDEQNKDGGQDSLQQVAIAKQELMGLLQEANAAQNTSNPTTRKAAKKEVERLADRIARLDAIEQSYMQGLEEEKVAVQQTAATPTSSMSEEALESMDAQYQGILGKTRVQSERVRVMQEYLDKISEESFPVVVLTRANYAEKMKAEGCEESRIKIVERYVKMGKPIGGFTSNGKLFLMEEGLTNINEARVTYVHERQHVLNTQNSKFAQAIVEAAGGNREMLVEWVKSFVGNEMDVYKSLTLEGLADELICRCMEIAYTSEEFSVDLQSKGIPSEVISIITEIDNEQRSSTSLANARRRGRRNENANVNIEGGVEENGRDSGQVSGGILGNEAIGSSGSSNGGARTGSTGEGAEVISDDEEELNTSDVPESPDDVAEQGTIMNMANQQAEGNIMFRTANGSLVGMHNISEDKLRKALKQGGLANPSTAVVNIAEYLLDGYGDISLIMPSSLVDASTGDNVGTYTGDAWTPTYPPISRKVDDKGWKAIKDLIRSVVSEDSPLYHDIINGLENYLEDNRSSKMEFVFLKEKGIEPEIAYKGADGFVGIRNLEAILGVQGLRDGLESYERYKNASPIAKRSFNMWLDAAGNKQAHKELKEQIKKEPKLAEVLKLNEDVSFAAFDSFTYDIFRKEQDAGKIDTYDTMGAAARYVDANNLRGEFEAWLESLMEQAGAKEVFFAGYTRGGDRIYKDNTLENVSRHMRLQGRTNAYDDHGLSATKSALLQRLTSLSQIRKNKARLQNESAYNKEYDALKDRLWSIISQLADMQEISSNQFMNVDYAESRLQESFTKKNPIAHLNKEYGYDIDPAGEYADELKSFIKDVQQMPAKYFETKFERPVYLNEFAAAVMPTTTSEDVKQAVSEAGLPIFEYDSEVEGSRKEATLKATEGEGIRFRTARTEEEFNATQQEAVREKGIIAPGLWETSVNVVEVPKHDFTGRGIDAIHKAEKWALEHIVKEHIYHDGQEDQFRYLIDEDTVGKFLSKSSTGASDNLGVHLAALKMLPQIIDNSIDVEIHPDYRKVGGARLADNGVKDEGLLVHRMYGAINIDGKIYRTKTTIHEFRDKINEAYDYKITEIELIVSGSSSSNARTNPTSVSAAKVLKGVEKSYDKGVKVLDVEYLKAVEAGDMEAAQRMVNEAAKLAGYDSNSDYQGSLAFNGAAPSGYAYYDTKEERIEAWENGNMEDDQTLGDYKDAGIDISNLGWSLTSPVAQRMGNEYTRESIKNLADAVNSDSRKIKVYRAVDADIEEDSIRNGDWVTPSRAYAEYHIGLQDWKEGRIIEQEVDIDDIWWDGNDINEWGYNDGKGYAYKNTPNNRKLLAPVTYDNNGNIIPLSERFNEEKDDIRFRTSNNNQAIFVSNAAKAVEGIKQEKATPEQWLKMIEKNGGLKAGEDKWMGLSDFLKASDKKTLTKQEVLDFINENMIVIEETHYAAGAEDDAENTYAMIERILQEKFGEYIAEYYEQNNGEDDNLYGGDSYEYAIDKLREEMNDEFPYTIERSNSVVYLTFPYEETDDLQEWADKLGVKFAPQNPINYTRLDYTTDGLNNKHEIALTVPTIESWNKGDDIHFGDAGDGRAIAWIRFGETWEQRPSPQISRKVLVIDEIQSKRHQAGREEGYTNKKAFEKAMAELEEVGADRLRRRSALIKTLYEKYGQSLFDFMKSEGTEYNRRLVPNEEVMTPDEVQEYYATSQDDIYQEEARLKEQYLEGVPDAPFDKNWHELAMKRMLRYAAENGYDAIAWTKGDQQAERYNIGNVVKYIDVAPYEAENSSEVNGFDVSIATGGVATLDLYVTESGEITSGQYGPENLVGKQLSDVVGKDLAAKILSTDRSENSVRYEGDNLRIGGEGMKGFYDKILPVFMNKYGKKWGVKVEDIHLNLEGGLDMHSIPVTDEMKASVMEGQVMFRMRGENESAKEFTDSIVKDFKDDYNAVAPIEIVELNSKEDVARFFNIPAEDITDDDIQFIKNDVEKKDIWAAYHPDLKKIVIFVRDSLTDSKKGELALIHENIHAINGKYPEFLALGEYLWNRVEEGTKEHKYKTAIQKFYPEHKWHDELSAYVVSEHMQNGTLDELKYILDLEHTNILNKILNTSGYGKERKSDRAGFFRNVLRKRSSGKVGRTSEKKGGASELTAEERRIIGEYFPEFNKTEDVRMRVNSQGKELTEGQEEFFANSKAVDKDGNLLVLYHGTPRAGFTEFKSGWFTTSKEDAISYSGDRKGRLFDPNEKYEPETLTAGDFRLGYMTFDSEEDRAAFLGRFPYADEVMSEREYEDARMGAEDEEYDALTARRKEFAEVWNAYREYERERFVDTTIGDLIANPEAYIEEDLMRAMLEYDSNASLDSLDDMDAAERKDALVSALQNANEETEGGILGMVIPTRVPRNGEGFKHNDLGNRTYEVYANVENPYEIDAKGRGSEFESGDIYKSVEEALADEQYDGIIIRNWRVGRTQQLGDVVVPKNGSQIKLTSNENPTESSDIRFRITEEGEDPDIRFSIRTKPAPKKIGTGYKVFYLKNGKLYPPMVANLGGVDTPVGVWLDAEGGTRAGVSKTGRPQVKKGGKGTQGGGGTLAYRPGWHLGEIPYALQFNRKDENGEKALFPANFVWAEVEYANDIDYQEEAMSYGYTAKGEFQHSLAGLPKLPTDGSYRYRTNPNPETDPWIITGAMKVNRLLTPSEVDQMVIDAGREPQKRQEGAVTDAQIEALNKELGLEETVSFRFSSSTADEIDIKAMRGISTLRAFNVSFNEMRKIFYDVAEETEKAIMQLRAKQNRTAYENEKLAREEKELRAIHRRIDWWESVNSQLVSTDTEPTSLKDGDFDLEPRTPAEFISKFLTMSMTRVNKQFVDKEGKAGIKKVNKRAGVMLTQDTLRRELGWNEKDWSGFRYILSESEGKSLDEIAEMISEDADAQSIFVGMDVMDIKNEIIDFLQSVRSYVDIRDYIKNERTREAKEERDYLNGLVDATIEQIESSTGMTIDEYNDRIITEELKDIERILSDVETSEIYGKFEDLTDQENEAYQRSLLEETEGGIQEGDQVVPDLGDGAMDSAATENSEPQGDSRGTDTGDVGDRADESGGSRIPPIGNKKKGLVQEPMELSSESASVDEVVNKGRQKAINENVQANDIFSEKVQRLNNSLAKLRSALAAQREYDVNTVKIITALANELLQIGRLTDMSRSEIKRLLSVIKDATGKEDLSIAVERLMDIMIANQLRSGKSKISELTKIKASKVNASGVEVRGSLDVAGQQMLQTFKDSIAPTMTDEALAENIAIEESNLDSDSDVIRKNAENRLAGYYLAQQYRENILASEAEEKSIREEIKRAKEQHDAGLMDKDAYKEFVKSCYDAIRENRMERVTAYEKLANQLAAKLAGSILNAKLLKDAEKARIEQIHHFANSDMQGMPSVQQGEVKKGIWNNTILRFLFKPLATFDQMLRSFAPKSRNGEGYLWNHFMGGWLRSSENEFKGIQAAHEQLDAKVRSMFAGVKRWSDLFSVEKKLPTMEVKFWDGEKMADFTLTQGNLLYIYMVNKMTDGKMKLRKMGITEEDVNNIARELDPRFIELADWIQDTFLPGLREKYNTLHEKMFGAPMAAIDNYFPIRVLANARTREVELAVEESSARPSTITGSIIKRTKNSLALDILGSDAFDVVLEHIEQMEHWAAFAEFNRDLNTLLSYRKFRNRVQNMRGIYGAGTTVWNNFRSVAEIVAGVYKPAVKGDSLDKLITNIAKGVTGAKISFRVYTALKQFLSAPAFVSDASAAALIKSLANPYKAWTWAMKELPLFEKRWKSRQAGDSRLMKTESDWKLWKNNIVELAGRYGMTPNAFVDALTVSIGARAIYETKRNEYVKLGYTQDQAEEKAKRDATVLFNESQQSNESAFLSAAQVDRTVASILITVFRNSSMGYQRMYVDALRNIKHMFKKGYKAESLEYMKKQMMRDGLTEDQAERAANRIYNRSFARSATRLATFGFLVQFAWNLGPYMAYLLMGDDDEEKKSMIKDAAVRGLVGGPVEGLAAGQAISSILGDFAMNEEVSDPMLKLPATSDMESIFRQLEVDPVRAVNDIFNLVIQSGVGVNPQTITDAVVAIIDGCNGDLETSKEAAFALMRILQTPQSQIEKLYMEEIDFTAEEALDMSVREFAERYAKYKVMRTAPLTKWMYSDEKEKELEDKYIKTFTKKASEMERTHGTEEAQEFFEYYDSEYKETSESLRDLKKQLKEAILDSDTEGEGKANEDIDNFLESEEFKKFEELLPHIKAYEAYRKALQKTDDPEERSEYAQKMIQERNIAVEKLRGK